MGEQPLLTHCPLDQSGCEAAVKYNKNDPHIIPQNPRDGGCMDSGVAYAKATI